MAVLLRPCSLMVILRIFLVLESVAASLLQKLQNLRSSRLARGVLRLGRYCHRLHIRYLVDVSNHTDILLNKFAVLLSCIQALLSFRLESRRVWLVAEVFSFSLAASRGWMRLRAIPLPVLPTRAILAHPRLCRWDSFLSRNLLSQSRA